MSSAFSMHQSPREYFYPTSHPCLGYKYPFYICIVIHHSAVHFQLVTLQLNCSILNEIVLSISKLEVFFFFSCFLVLLSSQVLLNLIKNVSVFPIIKRNMFMIKKLKTFYYLYKCKIEIFFTILTSSVCNSVCYILWKLLSL